MPNHNDTFGRIARILVALSMLSVALAQEPKRGRDNVKAVVDKVKGLLEGRLKPGDGMATNEIDAQIASRVFAIVEGRFLSKNEGVFASKNGTILRSDGLSLEVSGAELKSTPEQPTEGVKLTVQLTLKTPREWRLHQVFGDEDRSRLSALDIELVRKLSRRDWHRVQDIAFKPIVFEVRPRSQKLASLVGAGWNLSVDADLGLRRLETNILIPEWPSARMLADSLSTLPRAERVNRLETMIGTNSLSAMVVLGNEMLVSQDEQTRNRGIGLLQRASDAGSSEAASSYGWHLLASDRDSTDAIVYLEKAGRDDIEALCAALLLKNRASPRVARQELESLLLAHEECPVVHLALGKISLREMAVDMRVEANAARVVELSQQAYRHFKDSAERGSIEGVLLTARAEQCGFGTKMDVASAGRRFAAVRQAAIHQSASLERAFIGSPEALLRECDEAMQSLAAGKADVGRSQAQVEIPAGWGTSVTVTNAPDGQSTIIHYFKFDQASLTVRHIKQPAARYAPAVVLKEMESGRTKWPYSSRTDDDRRRDSAYADYLAELHRNNEPDEYALRTVSWMTNMMALPAEALERSEWLAIPYGSSRTGYGWCFGMKNGNGPTGGGPALAIGMRVNQWETPLEIVFTGTLLSWAEAKAVFVELIERYSGPDSVVQKASNVAESKSLLGTPEGWLAWKTGASWPVTPGVRTNVFLSPLGRIELLHVTSGERLFDSDAICQRAADSHSARQSGARISPREGDYMASVCNLMRKLSDEQIDPRSRATSFHSLYERMALGYNVSETLLEVYSVAGNRMTAMAWEEIHDIFHKGTLYSGSKAKGIVAVGARHINDRKFLVVMYRGTDEWRHVREFCSGLLLGNPTKWFMESNSLAKVRGEGILFEGVTSAEKESNRAAITVAASPAPPRGALRQAMTFVGINGDKVSSGEYFDFKDNPQWARVKAWIQIDKSTGVPERSVVVQLNDASADGILSSHVLKAPNVRVVSSTQALPGILLPIDWRLTQEANIR